MSTRKPSSKVPDNVTDNLEISGPFPGDKSAIKVKEFEIKNDYDKIKYLENKLLNDNSLSYDEYNKISEDITQARYNTPKKEQE